MIPYAAPMLVLYGSETGNAQDVGERIAREATRRHFLVRAMPMDAYDVRGLPEEKLVVFVASTTGQGDPPCNMRKFWKFLLRKGLPPDSLTGMRTAVFGLGDSGYQQYNVTAKKLAARLTQLGAEHVLEKGLGDDQARCGYYASLDPWLQQLWGALRRVYPLPPGLTEPAPDDQGTGHLDPPKFRVTFLPPPEKPEANGFTDCHRCCEAALKAAADMRRLADAACSIPPESPAEGASHATPFAAPLLANQRITATQHFQDVRHIEVDISGMQQTFAPGDVLAIAYVNAPEEVDAFLSRCGLDGGALVRVEVAAPVGTADPVPAAEAYIRDLVAGAMDVAGSPARRYFFEVARHFASAEHEQERLEYFASPEGADDLYNYNQREHRSILEALDDFKSVRMPLEWLLQLVPALQPRRFSIASSAVANPGKAELTVAVVDYKTPYKRHKRGLCSSWLSSLVPGKDVTIPVWLEKGSLGMPTSLATPLILVGPGTGVAPFRSFLQERQAIAIQGGEPVAPCILFFGCRNEAADYLYRREFEEFVENGALMEGVGLQVAFSRDHPQKRYVQHCIEECAAQLWDLLAKHGAVVYVAGSANKMPEDVASAFRKVAQLQGGMSEADSRAWLRWLEVSKRYHVETWS